MRGRGQVRIRDVASEARLFRQRAMLALVLAGLAVAMLLARFAYLQVLSFDEFMTRSEANRIKARPIVPARGLIFDRSGRLLADNVPAYRLELVPEQVDDVEATLEALGRVVALDQEDIERFRAARAARRSFHAVPIKLRLEEQEAARFAVVRHRFPGVDVVPYLTRRYPYGDLFAHVVGYVGRIDVDELRRLDANNYNGTTHTGKAGIERSYEQQLHGTVGFERVETNAEGRVLRVIEREPAIPGTHLYLTIDAGLQAAAVAAFDGQPGAAVAVDPRSGEVLALVSLPSYPPNAFVHGISRDAYRELLQSPGRPLFNRAVLGGYAPGSTIKPFIGLAGLELGVRRPEDTVRSTGAFRLPNQAREYRDWKRGGHGRVNLEAALAESVNTYFYQLAVDLGMERLSSYMAGFGFGRPTGIDLTGEVSGVLPSPQWKRAERGEVWYPGETVISGIGQGFWVVTPLQLVQATAMLANGGRRHPPHLLRAERNGFDGPIELRPQPLGELLELRDPSNLAVIERGMVAAMHGASGSARGSAVGSTYQIAGKTGTAQRVSRVGQESIDVNDLPFELRHRALFVAYAPAGAPEIALAVVVEHGGSGAQAAAPVARRILDAWILRDRSEPGDVAPALAGSRRP